MKYKHSLELDKIFNGEGARDDWMDLNIQQNFNNRMDCVNTIILRLKIGKNIISKQIDTLKWGHKL